MCDIVKQNLLRCMRTNDLPKCPVCNITVQNYLHMIKSLKNTNDTGVKYFVKVSCGQCSTILYSSEVWEKPQKEIEKLDFQLVFVSNSNKELIFQQNPEK